MSQIMDDFLCLEHGDGNPRGATRKLPKKITLKNHSLPSYLNEQSTTKEIRRVTDTPLPASLLKLISPLRVGLSNQ